MAKKLKGVTVKRQDKWFKDHKESFESGRYVPYFRVEDVPSSGIKVKTRHFSDPNRVIHLLSMNELFAYQLIRRIPDITECYEQYAIPLEESRSIAVELGVKHPVHSDTQVPAIQTIDFVCIRQHEGMCAFAIKEQSALENERTLQKLAIQEGYCALNNIEFTVLDSSVLKTQYCENLERLSAHAVLDKHLSGVFNSWLVNFVGLMSEDRHERVARILHGSAKVTGIPYQRAANFLYHAIWINKLTFNWDVPFVLEFPASDLNLFPSDA